MIPKVSRLEFLFSIKFKCPFIFSGGVSSGMGRIVKLDVVVNTAVINQRAEEWLSIESLLPLAPRHVLCTGHQVINGKTGKELRRKRQRGRMSWLIGPHPWRNTIIHEVSEIRALRFY